MWQDVLSAYSRSSYVCVLLMTSKGGQGEPRQNHGASLTSVDPASKDCASGPRILAPMTCWAHAKASVKATRVYAPIVTMDLQPPTACQVTIKCASARYTTLAWAMMLAMRRSSCRKMPQPGQTTVPILPKRRFLACILWRFQKK